ncbi:TPA: hypothetical protein OXK24_003300 [Acinetobacter baumannii]|uniref:Uncharacterized protein n=1 Tax=Acinetobacter baumannii TaxID=470 RepID=A0AAP1AF15_ACIBA|nr:MULTISPECIES: hypothetical protein [Acinetobacter]EXD21824.1 hypothetical protein J480_3689 [Acinetobacter baumannii 34654]KCW32445.1 hypothetical protein J474_0468 [Acinetobacter baumannii 6935]AVE56048.1 hypothetical protein AM442_16315 [Acinetobacter baumannii]AVO89416.1 hypothetical protein AM480_00225 [Acinetobacter baumannii]EGT99125.1 hypothetical protein ABNIH4_17760 [Acinetobacter baumannii ABNIH4]
MSSKESQKQQVCGCEKLLPLMEKLLEQTTILIQQNERKDNIVLAAIEQNNELLMQYLDEEEVEKTGSHYLDSKPKTL